MARRFAWADRAWCRSVRVVRQRHEIQSHYYSFIVYHYSRRIDYWLSPFYECEFYFGERSNKDRHPVCPHTGTRIGHFSKRAGGAIFSRKLCQPSHPNSWGLDYHFWHTFSTELLQTYYQPSCSG